jgi:hypothetical protein
MKDDSLALDASAFPFRPSINPSHQVALSSDTTYPHDIRSDKADSIAARFLFIARLTRGTRLLTHFLPMEECQDGARFFWNDSKEVVSHNSMPISIMIPSLQGSSHESFSLRRTHIQPHKVLINAILCNSCDTFCHAFLLSPFLLKKGQCSIEGMRRGAV